jgi:hypothetical protein
VPNTGYTFDGWTPAFPSTVTASATYTANFVKDDTQWFTVTFAAGANGTLSGTTSFPNILTGTDWSTAVTTVPTPVPNTGYTFDGWTPAFPSTVTASATYTANFVKDDTQWFTVTFAAGANGTLSGTTSSLTFLPEPPGRRRSTVPTPVPNTGYTFDGWTPAFPSTVTASATYTANFVIDDAQWFTVTFAAGANGTLSGTTSFPNILTGTAWSTAVTTVPTPVPNTGYTFDGWTPAFPSTVTASATYTANFVKDDTQWFTVTFAAGANGTLSGTTSFSDILTGATWLSAVTVPTPVPNTGYTFDGWTPVFPSTVTASATYTANFVIERFDPEYSNQWSPFRVRCPIPSLTADTVTASAIRPISQGRRPVSVTFARQRLSGTTFLDILTGTPWSTAVTTVPTPVPNTGYAFDGWTPASRPRSPPAPPIRPTSS